MFVPPGMLLLPFVPVLSNSQLTPARVCRNHLRPRLEVIWEQIPAPLKFRNHSKSAAKVADPW